jgi:hypothetical protein
MNSCWQHPGASTRTCIQCIRYSVYYTAAHRVALTLDLTVLPQWLEGWLVWELGCRLLGRQGKDAEQQLLDGLFDMRCP